MTLRQQLKKDKTVRGRRWTVRRDSEGNLTEVKMTNLRCLKKKQ